MCALWPEYCSLEPKHVTNFVIMTLYVLCWVPVTTARRVLKLRIEERPPIWRVAANILNKQSRTADEG